MTGHSNASGGAAVARHAHELGPAVSYIPLTGPGLVAAGSTPAQTENGPALFVAAAGPMELTERNRNAMKYSHTCPVWCSPLTHTEDDHDVHHYSAPSELEVIGATFTAGLYRCDEHAFAEDGGVQVWLTIKGDDDPTVVEVYVPISSVLRVTDFLHSQFYLDQFQGMPALAELSDVT